MVTDESSDALSSAVEAVLSDRGRPLLVMYWAPLPDGGINDLSLATTFKALTEVAQLSYDEPLNEMDVLIHTLGGEPTAAYRIAQLVRDFTKSAAFLVPVHAWSGGTLICLAADEILLGHHAVLSPIDITLSHNDGRADLFPDETESPRSVELVAIDNFIEVAKTARIEIEQEFRRRGWKSSSTSVESDMLCEMTRQLGVLNVAKYHREKNITQEYARELLQRRMGIPGTDRIDNILRRLVVEAPAHEFPMDVHILKDIGLPVQRMPMELADKTRAVVHALDELARGGQICQLVNRHHMPFIRYWPNDSSAATDVVPAEKTKGRKRDKANGKGPAREESTATA